MYKNLQTKLINNTLLIKTTVLRLEKLDLLKKRPTKRPDWNDLMQEIEKFRFCPGLLKKATSNDRSQPILSKSKVKGMFVYESETETKNADILKDIQKGRRLRHVKCNDRSKPNLRGIKSFKRQLTKEEKNGVENLINENYAEEKDELEDIDKLKDDLESTKQLLELEVRSKQLLDKTNKKLQLEIDQLKADLEKYQNSDISNIIRKISVNEKRKSIVRTISENSPDDIYSLKLQEEIFGIEELKEEADEARKLAEDWESKYKEMQRQMEDFEYASSIKINDSTERMENEDTNNEMDKNQEIGMLKREIQQLQMKFRNNKEKQEFLIKERCFLNERLDILKESILKEVSSRKNLKKEIREMNAAFKKELADDEYLEQQQKDDIYFDDNDFTVEKTESLKTESIENSDMDDEDEEIYLDDLLRNLDEKLEDDKVEGASFVYIDEDENLIENTETNHFCDEKEQLLKKCEKNLENVTLMSKSNQLLKSKIDMLFDILQIQKEKHQDLKQELNRMLIDIQ